MDLLDSLFRTKVKIVVNKEGKPVSQLVELGDIFAISEEDISNEMSRQAGLYAYFATQLAMAEYSMATASAKRETEYAVADEYYRKELGGKKYTEAVIRSMILQDESYQNSVETENGEKRNYRLLRAICTALEMRATMLQSLGAHLRHELDMTGINIRERQFQAAISDVRGAVTVARRRSDDSKR